MPCQALPLAFLRSRGLDPARNRLAAGVEPPRPGDVKVLPEPGDLE